MKDLILSFLLFLSGISLCLSGPINHSSLKLKIASAFIENKGQIIDQNNTPNPAVLYLLTIPGLNVQLRRGGFSYDLYRTPNIDQRFLKSDRNSKIVNHPDSYRDSIFESNQRYTLHDSNSVISFHRIDINLLNANPNPSIETSDPSYDYLNYYTTGTPVNGITSVHSYKTITYKNIYPNIDLEFLSADTKGFKYNFVVHPGGNLSVIRMKIAGPEIELSSTGSLFLKTTVGTIEEEIPMSYYRGEDPEKEVKCRFLRIGENTFGIKTEGTVPGSTTLFIDPIPRRVWGTYYGGSLQDAARVSLNPDGNLIVYGSTQSTDNIATAGSYQTTLSGQQDFYIAKFTPDCQRLWATYYGGPMYENAGDCQPDNAGNLYLSGITESSTNIATPGSFKPTFSGNVDVVLAKFSPGGFRIWATYYGASGDDQCWSCCPDNHGNIYLAGFTNSTDSIATTGSFRENKLGYTDDFLVKFDSSGQRKWGTYYGGSNGEAGGSVYADTNNNVLFTGQTNSPDSISTPGCFQPNLGNGSSTSDGYMVLFNSAGQRQWATYYGGSQWDAITNGKIGKDGYIYIVGSTESPNAMASAGCYQPDLGGARDAFLARFTIGGSRTWGTYFGGSNYEWCDGFTVDDSSNVFIVGQTMSTDNIATPGAYQSSFMGIMWDMYLAKFDSGGQRIWGTYYGDTTVNGDAWDCVTVGDTIYMAGSIVSGMPGSSRLTTPGSYQPDFAGVYDGLLVKFTDCDIPDTAHQIVGPFAFCIPYSGILYTVPSIGGATSYLWEPPPGATVVSGQGTNIAVINFGISAVSGVLSVRGVNACGPGEPDTLYLTLRPRPVPVITGDTLTCTGKSNTYFTQPGQMGYQWTISSGGLITGGGTLMDDSVTVLWNIPGAQSVWVNYTDQYYCEGQSPSILNVTAYAPAIVGITISAPAEPICAGSQVTITATPVNPGTNPVYQWKVNGLAVGTNAPSYTYIPLNGDIVTCVLSSVETCTTNNPATSNQLFMVVNSYSVVDITITASVNPLCQGNPVIFRAFPTNGGANPGYQWKVNGINVGPNNPVYSFSPNNGAVVSCVLNSSIYCPTGNPAFSNPITMIVYLNLPAGISIAASTNPFCPGNSVTFTAATINGGLAPFYQWKVNGANAGSNSSAYTYNPVSGDLVSCILTSSLACVTGNPATSNTIIMSGTLAPIVTFTRCNDSITTTNAKPFRLKGGIPLNGTYSGAGVSNGIYHPAIAGPGNHQITYTYTNAALCSANAIVTIVTITPSVMTCGNPITDIRDNKVYQTIQIGTQCWMAENLNYGYAIDEFTNQRDNCITEKYIRNSSSGIHNSFYQWDEIMNYDEVVSTQGLCPPAWHVPTEADWNTLFAHYVNNGFAGSPLKYSGFSGFNALLYGARHMNKNWDYQGFATFFWSSEAHGKTKAWAHGMNDTDPSISIYPALRSNAFPVRCLKD